MSSSWIGFLCCPRKADHHSEAAAYDGPGGMQLLDITDIARSPSITDCTKENVACPSQPGVGLSSATDDPEHTLLSAQSQTSNALNSELELLYEKRIQDLEDELNLVLRRNKELSARVCELEDLLFPEIERTSWTDNQPTDRLKEQLGKSLKDKRGQERRALKAEENLRDLKHQNAILQKRLFQAVSLSPGHVPRSPVLPPVSSNRIGPMFSVLRDATVKLGHVIPQDPAEVSGLVQETGESGSPTGMHEVLEKIRSGVPLKPVTPPQKIYSSGSIQVWISQKSPLSLVASLEPKSLPEGSESQFNGTLREQRVEPTVLLDEQPSTSAMSMSPDYCILTESTEMSPGNDALRNLCALEKMENPGPSRDLGEASGSGGSTDDEGSTSSTLPVTSTHSTDDDQVTETDAIELISGFEAVEDLTKECYHAPSTFQRVVLELDSNSKNSSFGSNRQQDSEAFVQTPYEHAASFSETSVDQNYLEVEKSTVVLSEEMLDQNGNECRAETVLPFGPTKCTTGISLHVSSENQLYPHFSSSVCDSVNPSSQVSSAATMAMEKSGNSDIILATTEYQTSYVLNSVAIEHNNPPQAKMLENVDDLPVDACKNAEMAGNVASVASLGLSSLTANGKHPDAISPKSENLLFAQTIEMHPSIGSVQEDELSQIGGKPVAMHTLNIKQSLSDISLENVLAESESQKAEDGTSEDSLKAGADQDVAQLTNSEFF